MKFEIKRTSLSFNEQPHKDAYQEDFVRIASKNILGKRWVIYIDNLFEWIERLGEHIILFPKYSSNLIDPLIRIEIYDDYRE